MWLTCPNWNVPNSSSASLLQYSLYMWNRIADIKHQYPRPFQSTQLLSPLGPVLFERSVPCTNCYSIFHHASHYQFHLRSVSLWSIQTVKCLLSVYEASTQFLILPKFRCDITLSILSLFQIQTHFLHVFPQVLSNFSSNYPRYYLCSFCHETECAIFATFCSFWLLL